MNLQDFLDQLKGEADTIDFNDTISVIDSLYHFTPCAFKNGELFNQAGQNNGSCKLFAFAKLHKLDELQTLACFGRYYREEVLTNPLGSDHQNIRNFMQTGWSGIEFEDMPLQVATIKDTNMNHFENVNITKRANIYFDGQVTSRSIQFTDGETKTLGIMLPGEYTFNTGKPELMEIMGGDVDVLLAGQTDWQSFKDGESFNVDGNSSFQIKVKSVTDYCCSFID